MVSNSITTPQGLISAMSGELVYFPKSSLKGLILNLISNSISVVILSDGYFRNPPYCLYGGV